MKKVIPETGSKLDIYIFIINDFRAHGTNTNTNTSFRLKKQKKKTLVFIITLHLVFLYILRWAVDTNELKIGGDDNSDMYK